MVRVRFTRDLLAPATVRDGVAAVEYGELQGDQVVLAKERIPLGGVRLLPPSEPSKILCVGRNYADHAKELGNPVPEKPLVFLKPPSSLAAAGDPIVYPFLSGRVDFEGELGVVIGRRARHVPASRAHEVILGYTCVNDVTARDLQKSEGQWTRGKGFDTFCPVGPGLMPSAGVDPGALRVRTYVNGVLRQDGSVADMLFNIARVIEFLSECMTLERGDLIATGTPAGVGELRPGDRVRVEIDGVGSLENPVIAETEE